MTLLLHGQTAVAKRDTALDIRSGRGLFGPRVGVLVAVGVLLPIVASSLGAYEARYALAISIPYAIGILGGNIVASTSGDINLAIGAEMAIGAYGSAYIEAHHHGFWLALLVGVVATVIGTFVISLGVVRLKGVYTALATFALAFCIPDLATYLSGITGGGSGEYVSPTKIAGLTLGGGTLSTDYVAMAVFVVAGVIWLAVIRGGAGRPLLLLGTADPVLASFGRSSYWLKVGVWTIGGLLAAIAGILYGQTVGYLNPQEYTFYLSLFLFVGAVVGGTTSVMGALIGGIVVGAVPIYLGGEQGGVEDILFGLLLVAALLVGRSGVWPRIEDLAWKVTRQFVAKRTLSDG